MDSLGSRCKAGRPASASESSIVQYMLVNTSVGDDEAAADGGDGLHELPVIFHHDNDDDVASFIATDSPTPAKPATISLWMFGAP